jgi:hypothetical protein
MDEGQQVEYRPEETSGAGLNIGQVVQGSMYILLGDMATMDAATKFKTLTTDDFQQFYQKFNFTFLTARRYLDPETKKTIQAFLAAPLNLEKKQDWEDAADLALSLALRMQEDLEDRGLWSVFGPAGEPPFMMDVIY